MFRVKRLIREGEMDAKKITVKSIICAVILSLSMPILGLADPPHGKKDRHSRKKFEKFVNGHDARDGKWDRDRDWERERERDRFRFSNRFDRNRWDDNDEIGRYRQSLRRSLRFGSFDLFRNLR